MNVDLVLSGVTWVHFHRPEGALISREGALMRGESPVCGISEVSARDRAAGGASEPVWAG
jgi:hypothetical protein